MQRHGEVVIRHSGVCLESAPVVVVGVCAALAASQIYEGDLANRVPVGVALPLQGKLHDGVGSRGLVIHAGAASAACLAGMTHQLLNHLGLGDLNLHDRCIVTLLLEALILMLFLYVISDHSMLAGHRLHNNRPLTGPQQLCSRP